MCWPSRDVAFSGTYTTIGLVEGDDGELVPEELHVEWTAIERRFSFVTAWESFWWAVRHEPFPLCCVVAYCWWEFWHGSPGIRWAQRHPGKANRGYVPCLWHQRTGKTYPEYNG